MLSDDEPVDLPEDALVLVLHEVEVAPDVGEVPADLGHAAAHLLEDGGEGRVDVHQDLQVVRKVAPSPASKFWHISCAFSLSNSYHVDCRR